MMVYLEAASQVIRDVVEPSAATVDQGALFPRAAVNALGGVGLLGLISAKDVGGLGEGHRAATLVVEALARVCGSTAMVVCMHYAAAAVIEAHGPRPVREAIAAGRHLSTLAFSEVGSRSQFWAPLSTATRDGAKIRLDAQKSWVTSAGEADSYVWSSRPIAVDGASTIWLVPRAAAGLSIPAPFNGLGLRGNASSPVTATAVLAEPADRLGPDGGGFDIMMGIVLPYFQVMNAAFSVGTMEAATVKTATHAGRTRFEHLGHDPKDVKTLEWIKKISKTAKYVTSHCEGAFLLGAAGLLDGRQATTFPADQPELQKRYPSCKVKTDQRIVIDGNVITSAGGLASYEASLYVVKQLFGADQAATIATALVFGPSNLEETTKAK
jgi:alkylation response protein AidB-like acyl-CoA dehydrogenase